MRDPSGFRRSSVFILAALMAMAHGSAVAAERRPTVHLAACPSGKTVTVTAARNAAGQFPKEVEASVGDAVRITLPVQGGTGFTWHLQPSGKAPLATTGRVVRGDESARPGGPARQVFTFRAAGPGKQALDFHYLRPWERAKAPGRTFRIVVNVSGC